MHIRRLNQTRLLYLSTYILLFSLSCITIPWEIASAQANSTGTPTTRANSTGTPPTQTTTIEYSYIEEVSPHLSINHISFTDGIDLSGYIINGSATPPNEYMHASIDLNTSALSQVVLPDFPSYDWVFGCSSVSGSMIAAYYDRNGYTNMYTGPTNGGVMPTTDTLWPIWSDGHTSYPNNPLIASHNGIDGRLIRGSIDDYWVEYNSIAMDPYITNGWPQHTWGSAIGDYMKTSQSEYGNVDGSTSFYGYIGSNVKLTCSAMEGYGIANQDGTFGRKLFYEARGYSVSDCFNQSTDNKVAGGFSLTNFQSEIDAGNPVLLNLAGHSIVGYGYSGSTIYIRDTWDNDPSHTYSMNWGGSYSGMELLAVSIVHLLPLPPVQRSFLPFVQIYQVQVPINILRLDNSSGDIR